MPPSPLTKETAQGGHATRLVENLTLSPGRVNDAVSHVLMNFIMTLAEHRFSMRHLVQQHLVDLSQVFLLQFPSFGLQP
jgi:hypothetical protein